VGGRLGERAAQHAAADIRRRRWRRRRQTFSLSYADHSVITGFVGRDIVQV
jgi:hypothetical protein